MRTPVRADIRLCFEMSATSDHLGSGDLILDSAGAVLARESFTPFGARRGSNWQGLPSAADQAVFADVTRRGFTGHETLDAVSLIHMNGRVYDPQLARFLSVDPIIPTIALSQALNPFSYVMNNPLTLIDPSGYSWLSKAWKSVKKFFKKIGHFLEDSLGLIVGTALTYFLPGVWWVKLIVTTAISTAVNGGLTVGYSWGFGGARAGPGFAGAGAGPPGTTPGINPTPQIPGMMALQGRAAATLSEWFSDAVRDYLAGPFREYLQVSRERAADILSVSIEGGGGFLVFEGSAGINMSDEYITASTGGGVHAVPKPRVGAHGQITLDARILGEPIPDEAVVNYRLLCVGAGAGFCLKHLAQNSFDGTGRSELDLSVGLVIGVDFGTGMYRQRNLLRRMDDAIVRHVRETERRRH